MEFCAYRHAHCEVAGSTDYDHYSLFCQEPDPRGYHNRYKCKLCETRFMAQRDLNEHCSSDAHQSRLRQVVSLRRDGVVKCCALLQKLLDGVTNKIFRKEIEHELYMILLNNRFDEAHPVHNPFTTFCREWRFESTSAWHRSESPCWRWWRGKQCALSRTQVRSAQDGKSAKTSSASPMPSESLFARFVRLSDKT
jgi:hypothetical protein